MTLLLAGTTFCNFSAMRGPSSCATPINVYSNWPRVRPISIPPFKLLLSHTLVQILVFNIWNADVMRCPNLSTRSRHPCSNFSTRFMHADLTRWQRVSCLVPHLMFLPPSSYRIPCRVEPSQNRFCLRCCASVNDQVNCNSHRYRAGCPDVIPGTYSFPDLGLDCS